MALSDSFPEATRKNSATSPFPLQSRSKMNCFSWGRWSRE